jgi:D-alanyl-lipoteichoic acid acyltransferase DltB (MBOAT superfamily)
MLFSSAEFIFLFLPITFFVYFWLASRYQSYARLWLLFASIFFYGWWDYRNILLIAISMVFNFVVGNSIAKERKRSVLVFGVTANLVVLFYYKYANFFMDNLDLLLNTQHQWLNVVLPLGISFFTFTQIAYLVDCYNGKAGNYKFSNYCLFVTFFPHLIAGPIVHHSQLMPQFDNPLNMKINYDNIARGLFIFNMGLAKKIVIADTISTIVSNGYSNTGLLTTSQAWITSFAYSMQLYFDFSGYSDMAIGLGLLFNIDFPLNFNSPYKSVNIQEFWRRWHMTLSKFLRDYIYVPLGGNRRGEWIKARNLMITFVLGGIWHGAGWTFIFWGFLHGFALVIHNFFSKKFSLPNWAGIILTFLFVNVAWVFFRAPSWADAMNVLSAMVGMQHPAETFTLINDYYFAPLWIIGVVLLFAKNTNELGEEFKPTGRYLWKTTALVVVNLVFLNSVLDQEFLYFDF